MSNSSGDHGCDELHLPMGGLMFWCLASSLLLGLGSLGIYIYFLHKGQFDDPEDVKYQMFREDTDNEG